MSVTAPMMENQTTERLRELLPDMSRDLLEGLSSMVVSERKQTICKCLHFTYQLRKYIRTYESETDAACSTRELRQDRKRRIRKVVTFCKQQSSFIIVLTGCKSLSQIISMLNSRRHTDTS